jgi:hypothetical protein
MALTAHELEAVQVTWTSVNNEGHFTLEAERVFRPYLPSHCSGVTEVCHMELPAHALRAVQARLKSFSDEGNFTIEANGVFVRIYPYIAAGLLKDATWHSLSMHYVQYKAG